MSLDNLAKYNIILASKSPRRQELLKELGVSFDVQIKETEETYPDHLKVEQIALYLCELKANAFKEDEVNDDTLLITADTIVWHNNKVLDKPADYDDAVNILKQLSGDKHEVITGVCLKTKQKINSFHVSTDVYFKELTEAEIDHYITNYKPYDKAGAYGIQEWIGYIGINKIQGSYFNVMGLPTQRLYEELLGF